MINSAKKQYNMKRLRKKIAENARKIYDAMAGATFEEQESQQNDSEGQVDVSEQTKPNEELQKRVDSFRVAEVDPLLNFQEYETEENLMDVVEEKKEEEKKPIQILDNYVDTKEPTQEPSATQNSAPTQEEVPRKRRIPTELLREVDELKLLEQQEADNTSSPEPLLPSAAKPSLPVAGSSTSTGADLLVSSTNSVHASGRFPNVFQNNNVRASVQVGMQRPIPAQTTLDINDLYKFVPYTSVKHKRRNTLRNSFVNRAPPKLQTNTLINNLIDDKSLDTQYNMKAILLVQANYRRRQAQRIYAKLKKHADHRVKVLKEVLSTEETYVASLKVLKEQYLVPLREEAAKPNPLITKADLSKIFSDAEVILNVNEMFLNNFKARIASFDVHSKVSDVFIAVTPFFKAYSNYCNNYDRGQDVLRECKKKEEVNVLLKKLDKNAKTKLGMSELLILPIQRVPRYRLLLQDLLNHTDVEHPDRKGLEEAINKIMEVANHLNATMKEIEMVNDMKKLQELFNPPMNLIEAHRKLVKDGELSVIVVVEQQQQQQQKLYLHLFTDMLIYSKKEKGRFNYKGEIRFRDALLFDSANPEHNYFQVKVVPFITLILMAASKEDKYEWLALVDNCIKNAKPSAVHNATHSNIGDTTSTTKSVAISGAASNRLAFSNEECIRRMKKGATLLKYSRKVKPHFREFILSDDCLKLTWISPNKASNIAFCYLSEVKKMLLGQKTPNFSQYKNPTLENYSFSLLYKDRTLDIVCKDEKEFVIWNQGLSYLISEPIRDLIRKGEFKGETIGVDVKQETQEKKSEKSEEDLVSSLNEEKRNFKDIFEKIGDGYSFGQNLSGSLGHSNTITTDVFEPTVIKDFLFLDVDSLDTENSASAMITNTGEVFVFGKNDTNGRLGLGDTSDRVAPTMIKSLQEVKIKKVSMGHNHTIALDDNGKVYVWGSNQHGQLGLGGDIDKQKSPTLLDSIKLKVTDVEAGSSTSALVSEIGYVYTFGVNDEGQLGHGNKDKYNVPTVIEAVKHKKVITIAMGLWHSLILASDGSLFACGSSTYGQLGHGNYESILAAKQIESLRHTKIVQIAAGSLHSACISNRGDLYVWGNNTYGQLGNGTRDHSCIPTRIQTFPQDDFVKQVACGSNHCICLMKSGKVFAFGAGTYGRLGLKDEQDRVSPTLVTGLLDKSTRFITAGGSVSMAVCSHQWVPDKSVSACMNCNVKFTFFTRRHHCRYCGGIYCSSCTTKRCAVLRFGFDTEVRVCDVCYSILTKSK